MQPTIKFENGTEQIYKIAGEWTVDFARVCLNNIETIQPSAQRKAFVVCDGLQRIDITGAWILQRRLNRLRQCGIDISARGFKQEHANFIEHINALSVAVPPPQGQPASAPAKLAKNILAIQSYGINVLQFLGWCLVLMAQTILRPGKFRWRAFVKQCEETAVKATPIVATVSFLIAIVLDYQGAAQLKRFGAEIYSINLVTISVLREMAGLLTAIMVAGRSGSAFAAEIGAMKLNEEIDALSTTGMEPMEVLVLPRLVALTVMLPLLTFLADMTGLFGAGVLTVLSQHTSWLLFVSRFSDILNMTDFWIGIGKAPVFGFVIAFIGCYHGMSVSNSAESVGRETTNAVVNSIFVVMIIDAVFSIIFTTLGL